MIQKWNSTKSPRIRTVHWIAWTGIGSALGWFLAPLEYRRIGLGIGVLVGGLILIAWQRIRQRSFRQKEAQLGLGWPEHATYLFFVGLSMYCLWLSGTTWHTQPEKWLAALGGIILSLAGIVVFAIFWRMDYLQIPREKMEAPDALAIGVCAFGVAAVSLFLVHLGNPILGILGAAFCGWCGVIAIRKSRAPRQAKLGQMDKEGEEEGGS